MTTTKAWGVLWRSKNKLCGEDRALMRSEADGHVLMFHSREEARDWIECKYGYIRDRPDLRREPHGWQVPKAVRVTISVEEK